MATTINTITAIPPAGKRGMQVRDAFVASQEQFQDALSGIFVGEINTTISQTNDAVSAAANSKDTAVLKAAEAAQSASDAADSIDTTKGYKDAAATSASNADTSESNALDSKNAAATSENNAANSASAADSYKTDAANSASAAATSESNAATSASTANDHKTDAANSASAAATSESNAATSASNADNSESSALSSKNAAATSAANADVSESNALNTLKEFQDIYLGFFDDSHIPTKNNSGGALISGNLYFNTDNGFMKVYDGSNWKDAYVNMDGAAMAANNLNDLNSVSAARTNLGLKIGTNIPYVSGSSSQDFNAQNLVTSSITTSTLTETSARKYKENIKPLTGCLGVIEQLEPVTYNRKGSQLKEIGLIADDVLKVRPEYVSMLNGEVEGLFYQRIVADLIGSVKELQSEIMKLK